MRIGVDISQVVYEGTGSTRYTTELLKAMLPLSGDDEFVLFGSSLRLHHKLAGFPALLPKQLECHFTHIPPTLLHYLWNELHFMPVEMFTGKLDVFHASDATQPPTRAKAVTTVHDLVAYHYPETLHPRQVDVQKKRLAWVKKEASAVIAVSEATKNDLINLLDIPADKISVIYEGVSGIFNDAVRNDTAKIAQVREKYHLPERYLFNIGTLQPRKNLPRLVEAHKKLKDGPLLAIAGNMGWGRHIDTGDNIRLLGFVPDDDLPALYVGAYAFIYPALYEGFGLPVIEAMACGTPVITSQTSSLREVGGDAAILVDPHDTMSIYEGMKRLLGFSAQEYKLRQNDSVAHAKTFSWQTAAEQTLALYRKVAA